MRLPSYYNSSFPEWRDQPPYVMEDMILIQPDLASDTAAQRAAAEGIAQSLRDAVAANLPIVIVGCGTSEHASHGVAEILDAALQEQGAPAGRIEAMQAFDAALAPRAGGVLLAVSHGGLSKATVAVLEAAKKRGATTALITAAAIAPTHAPADQILTTPFIDKSWCHTIGYVSPILAAGLIASLYTGRELDDSAVRQHIQNALGVRPAAEAAGDRFRSAARVITAGSGIDRGPARELALKLAEGARLPSMMLDLENVLHGHLVAHDGETTLAVITTDPAEADRRAERTEQVLRASRHIGLRTVAILDERIASLLGPDVADAIITVPAAEGVPSPLGELLASAIGLQLLTVAVVSARQTNPDLLRREEAPYFEAVSVGGTKFPRS